jgi:hypothetical protein
MTIQRLPTASRRIVLAFSLTFPVAALTSGCASTGRMALAAGLHEKTEADQAILVSNDVAPTDVTPERHARTIQPAHTRPELMHVQLAATKPGAERQDFLPMDGDARSR